MDSSAIKCPHRIRNQSGGSSCSIVARVTGIHSPEVTRTNDEICRACQRELRSPELVNPVIGSLVYNAMRRIVECGGHLECNVQRATKLMRCAEDQLPIVLNKVKDRSFPPQLVCSGRRFPPKRSHPTIATGMLTAPRSVPTVEATLRSVREAGFDRIHLFAEPGSLIPQDIPGVVLHQRTRRLGNMTNFFSGLVTMLELHPDAGAVAMLQDDISVAKGLREWLAKELWPGNAGIVSLFTPRPHLGTRKGWELHSPGCNRICGAQAFVFRRDLLEQFVADPRIFGRLSSINHHDDAILAGWAANMGLKIAYHTPSLVSHIGEVSSLFDSPDKRNFADAPPSVSRVKSWKLLPQTRPPVIGLVGWNTPTGLGYQNRDLVDRGLADRWLIVKHPEMPGFQDVGLPDEHVRYAAQNESDERLRNWCEGLDWLLFIEKPHLPNLVRVAAHSGVGIACIANWEWLQPNMHWLQYVDTMICPVRHTETLLNDWKKRYGFGWRTKYLPWPIDANRFAFRQRKTCRKFLFVNGWGGSPLTYPDGSIVPWRRKGLDIVLDAARSAPDLQFLIRSQETTDLDIPPNVEWIGNAPTNSDLYSIGDVCVQPSRFEGLGLQLLECQAAGLPLVTTAAPPMNEHNPLKTIPTDEFEIVNCGDIGPFLSNTISSKVLAGVLQSLAGTDLSEASLAARRYITERHPWDQSIEIFRDLLRVR